MSNPGNNPGNAKIQSFLEALRASRGNSTNAPTFNRESGRNPFGELKIKKEIESKRIEQFHQARQQEWNKVYSVKEKEIARKIESIREQLKKLASQLKNLDKNLHTAVESQVVDYGEYQVSYFEHISKAIRQWQKSAASANTWLEMFNERVNRKGIYWQMAKSKGNNYTQSNERQVATSVG